MANQVLKFFFARVDKNMLKCVCYIHDLSDTQVIRSIRYPFESHENAMKYLLIIIGTMGRRRGTIPGVHPLRCATDRRAFAESVRSVGHISQRFLKRFSPIT